MRLISICILVQCSIEAFVSLISSDKTGFLASLSIGKEAGIQLQRLWKSSAQMDLINMLNLKSENDESRKALSRLLLKDSYNSSLFSDSHIRFKRIHNEVFALLSTYAVNSTNDSLNEFVKVFYLDGKDAATTRVLVNHGFDPRNSLYVANIFNETVCTLKSEFNISNVYHGTASDVLKVNPMCNSIPFVAYYLDGCSGSSEAMISIIQSIFCPSRLPLLPAQFFIGITLTEADPSGRSLQDREQDVTRYLYQCCAK